MTHRFSGVYCASITPMRNSQVDVEALQLHLRSLAEEGCDGVLLMGTTGEGPSLSLGEREAILQTALAANTGMVILAGTGTPSLPDTIAATKRAFDLGADGVVVVPPFYYRNASLEGLYAFYAAVIEQAVPQDGALLAYHIPKVSGVAVPLELVMMLRDQHGPRIAGLKDSDGDISYSMGLIEAMPELDVFVGSEKLLLQGLNVGAVGCITAGANVLARQCADVFRAWRDRQPAEDLQSRLSKARTVVEGLQPAPSTYKALLALRHGVGGWDVRPPLLPHQPEAVDHLIARLRELDPNLLPWLAAVG